MEVSDLIYFTHFKSECKVPDNREMSRRIFDITDLYLNLIVRFSSSGC